MKIYNLLNMGNAENGSRTDHQGGRLKTLLTSIGAIGLLSACGSAEATDSSRVKSLEPIKMAAVERVVKFTRTQCLALGVKSEKIDCLRQLSVQKDAEIAALDKGIEVDVSEIAAIDRATETEMDANDQRRTTVKVLSEVRDEAFVEDPSR